MKIISTPRPRPAGAVILLTALLAAGCGQAGTDMAPAPTPHAATAQTTPATTPHTATPATTGVGGAGRTAVAHPRRAAADHPVRPVPVSFAAGRVLRSFSGGGGRTLGSLSVKTPVVLRWHTSGHGVQLVVGSGFLLLNSPASAGRIKLPRGAYPRLRIATVGAWHVDVRAAG
jgi:hypothetical protein